MKEKDFSKGILKYALQNGITHNELSANYKDLIKDYYEYLDHVLLLSEIDEYAQEYRTNLFYDDKKKETFRLLLDYSAQVKQLPIIKYGSDLIELPEIEISKDSDANEIYIFLVKSLYGLDENFYNTIIGESEELFLKKDNDLIETLWNKIFEFLKIDNETAGKINDEYDYFYLFRYAFEDYCDENDYEY